LDAATIARKLKAAKREACGVKLNDFIPHLPTAKQITALKQDALEVYYGGAAGGGKSDWLLISALQYVDCKDYAALLLRRTFADLALPKALMDRASEWLRGTPATWNAQEKTWSFPSGATLTFGYLENENDKYRYQSAEFQFVGFDEVTQFNETQYTFLFSRLRRLANSDIPVRMRSASNPDGVGVDWVRRRFVPDTFVNSAGVDKFNRVWSNEDRVFVPALMDDNPYIDQDQYGDSLSKLGIVLEARLRSGDWGVEPIGALVKREWFGPDKYFVALPDGAKWKVRGWDLAMKDKEVMPHKRRGKLPDYQATVKACVFNGDLWLGDPALWRGDWSKTVDKIEQTMQIERTVTHATGKAMHETAAVQTLVRKGFALTQVAESENKIARANPWIKQASVGRVKLVGTPEQWADFQYWWWRFGTSEGIYDDSIDAVSDCCAALNFVFDSKTAKPSEFDRASTQLINAMSEDM
jgi:phage terminase large subunit-like protein